MYAYKHSLQQKEFLRVHKKVIVQVVILLNYLGYANSIQDPLFHNHDQETYRLQQAGSLTISL